MARQPIYITIVSSGEDRAIDADFPNQQPQRDQFDQYAVLISATGRYEVHLYTKGMDYSLEDAKALTNLMLNDLLLRASAIGHPVPLPGEDESWPCVLISDDPTLPILIMVRAKTVNHGEYLNVDRTPISAEREHYPLDLVINAYRASGFEVNQIPPKGDVTSRGYLALHPSSEIKDWQHASGTLIHWMLTNPDRLGKK